MKPKIKGNVVFTALLFLLFTFPAAAWVCPKDTIIIDGEIISIQKRERKVNLDSLEEAGADDVVKLKKPIRGSVGVFVGGVAPFFSSSAQMNNLTSLEDFLNVPQKFSVGPTLGIQGMVDISDNFAIKLAGAWSAIKYESFTINESQIANPEVRTNFENRNGELWQRYVEFIDPGFEERFSKIDMRTASNSLNFIDVDVSLRYIPKYTKEGWSGWMEFGFSPRIVISEIQPTEQFFFNTEGDWSKAEIQIDNFKSSWLFLNVASGASYKWKNGQAVEANLGYKGLPQQIYSAPNAALSFSNVFLTVGWSKMFYFRK